MNEQALKLKSIEYRKTVLTIIHRANAGHTGGSLSCVDILNVLYNRVMNVSPDNFNDPDHDRYIQSKGHSVEALYTVLADRGSSARPTRSANIARTSSATRRKVPASSRAQARSATGCRSQWGWRWQPATGAAIASSPVGDGSLPKLKLGSGHDHAHYKLDNLVAIVTVTACRSPDRRERRRPGTVGREIQHVGFAVRV